MGQLVPVWWGLHTEQIIRNVQLSTKKQKVSCCSLTANRLLFVFTIALELPRVNGNRLPLMITGSIATDLDMLGGDLEVCRHTEATRCTDGG